VLPHGLTEFDVHDVLNVFQVTGLDGQGRYFMEASPATEESEVVFFAEQDLLCALSTCPGGDLSAWGWSQAEESKSEKEEGLLSGNESNSEKEMADTPKKDMKSTCRPIRVQVLEIKDKSILNGWKTPEKSGYKGCHGMKIPGGEA
jgi:uncharacterized protein YcgI (DUF1989 family)